MSCAKIAWVGYSFRVTTTVLRMKSLDLLLLKLLFYTSKLMELESGGRRGSKGNKNYKNTPEPLGRRGGDHHRNHFSSRCYSADLQQKPWKKTGTTHGETGAKQSARTICWHLQIYLFTGYAYLPSTRYIPHIEQYPRSRSLRRGHSNFRR